MAAEGLRVSVLYSPAPRVVREWQGAVDAGSAVSLVIEASGLVVQGGSGYCAVGIWGRACRLDQAVREGDRIEVYRPLLVDPKVSRRERFRKQGVKTPGLFARRREGGKAGY